MTPEDVIPDMAPAAPETCPDCMVGTLQPRTVIYYAFLDSVLLSIPDFPAWVCDVCRHCEYDEEALSDLRAILGPAARLPVEPSRRRHRPSDFLPLPSRAEPHKGQN
jgi:hypothetical protein